MQEDKSIIEVSHVSKYFGDKTALDDVTLNVKKGEFVTILGPSGCGKTTLLRLIAGFQTASEGEIRISGMEITQTPPHKRPVNTVFQKYALFPHLNVYDNIAFPLTLRNDKKENYDQKIRNLIELVGLSGKELSYPSQLSGGQKQRVAIARALASNPDLLLLDEPTSALDSITTRALLELLKEIHEKTHATILIITHELSVVQKVCEKVVVIDGGQFIEQGRVEDIFNHPKHKTTRLLLGLEN